MSEDLIALVKSFIDSKTGDAARLMQILESLEQGDILDASEISYLEELKNPGSGDDTTKDPEGISTDTPESNGSQYSDEPSRIKSHDADSKVENHRSRKRAIMIVSMIAIAVIVYSCLNAYSVTMLEFRPHSGDQYRISPTEIHIKADVCNPSFFPASFNKYRITGFYNSQLIERATIEGKTVIPKSPTVLDGVFALNADALYTIRQTNSSFDPDLAKITTDVDAPIFGIIPFSIVKEYSAKQFQADLSKESLGSGGCW